MSSISKRRKEGARTKIKTMGDHKEFLNRITKTLYYGQLPTLPCLSLPVTEISCEVWSMAQRGRSLRRLHADAAAGVARGACVSPCALVLALLYLERLHTANPDYLAATPPADLFLVSLMVGNKFLQDDGEDDEVILSEWAASGGIDLTQLKKLEAEFLGAIDWNVFVSEKSFETGLRRLERRVALRQAAARGYFTYADLAAATAGADDSLLEAVARGWLAAAAAYVASLAALLALLASALLLARAAALRPRDRLAEPRAARPAPPLPAPPLPANATAAPALLLDDAAAAERLLCCTSWTRPEALEPGWSPTSVLSWFSRASLTTPLRRWLERLGEYGALARRLARAGRRASRRPGDPRCRWLDLGELGSPAMTDR